jgi:cytochrome P450
MNVCEREGFSQWESDRLDSAAPGASDEGHFDVLVNSWVLSRHVDVLAAMHCPDLRPIAPRGTDHPDRFDDAPRLAARAETQEALSSRVLADLDAAIIETGSGILTDLPTSAPVDLMAAYARPVCKFIASTMTGIPISQGHLLIPDAEIVSAAAAEPFDEDLALLAKAAGARLRTHFHSGPASLRQSGFVALSQTLCALLGNAWFALVHDPGQWVRLRNQPQLMRLAVEELLRYPGLTRMLFRIAVADVDLNGMHIRKGERIMLRITAANRDPLHFTDPNGINFDRRPLDHLTLGSSKHACVAGNLIRTVIGAATRLLIERYSNAALCSPVEWVGGSGFLFPAAIYVVLTA